MRTAALVTISLSLAASSLAADPGLARLHAGDRLQGFRATAIYFDDAGQPMGARLVHERTRHTLDLLRIESVPQSFTWIGTMPVSDQGESHTQEHLLLLKGTMGRTLSMRQTMSLSGSTAFTQQWRTSYMFHTAAGPDVFFELFAEQLKAMLHPNYTDEEIRREVRNFGVTEDADGKLRLEERGTVYNEMVSSTANPYSRAYRAAEQMLYGKTHPLSYNAGGEPSGIRTMKPEDIRNFQRATHHLANMGTIAAFPQSVALDTVLKRFDAVLAQAAPGEKPRRAQSLDDLPPAHPAPPGTIRLDEYPSANASQPSPILLVWPATRRLDADEQLLASLFVHNIAGDATTNFYKLLIDGKTRRIETGARSVSGVVVDHGGNPIFITLTDISPAQFTDEKLAAIRSLAAGEIARVAAFADGSPELAEFNDRVANRLTEQKRDLVKFIGTPPGFGFRGGNSRWMDHLRELESTPQARKSLTLEPQIAFVRRLLDSKKNFWRGYLAKWRVTGVTPYVAGARPSPALIAREAAERKQRVEEETARLQAKYGLADAQAALARYRAEADAAGAEIEVEAKKVPPIPFVKAPPLTLDDDLRYEVVKLAGDVPLVVTRFESMTSATVGIALRLDGIPREELRYVSLLPALISRVGVIENGKPVSYEEMSERMRKEILSLDAGFSANPRTARVELFVRGAGIGAGEALRAVDWMDLVLQSPDLRLENLPRIRDVVDQSLGALRNTMQAPEEYWVNNPVTAYRMQRNPAFLAADSFLTREYNALRLRWQLKGSSGGDAEAVAAFLARLGEAGRALPRADLKALLASDKAPGFAELSPGARALAADALKDLDLALAGIPEGSLGVDFLHLTSAMREDVLTPPAKALAEIDAVRRRILTSGGARLFVVGPAAMQPVLAPRITALAGKLDHASAPAQEYGSVRLIDHRLQERLASASVPVHVGLFSPNKQGGVIATSVPSAHFADFADKEQQLDFLASRLHAGGGPHGIFLKTLAAGLAYSNGLRGSVSGARVGYYAERTPELPQTVRFVVNELKGAQPQPGLGEYVMALAFGESRAAMTYELRAEGIAADLADGQPPEQVAKFRRSILALRDDPDLVAKLFARKDRVYGRMIPGYGSVKSSDVADAQYVVIGPDKQLDAWADYLKSTEGAPLYKLYARDFWMP